MDAINLPTAVEPTTWFVVFHPTSSSRLLSLLAFGHYKHVSAFGYYQGFKAWLVCDAEISGLRLPLVAHDAMRAIIGKYTAGCTIVKFVRRAEPIGIAPLSRIGFFCVTAVKHLLAVRCNALTPDSLYRYILANGGQIVHDTSNADYPH
jgi:hypothetical protein